MQEMDGRVRGGGKQVEMMPRITSIEVDLNVYGIPEFQARSHSEGKSGKSQARVTLIHANPTGDGSGIYSTKASDVALDSRNLCRVLQCINKGLSGHYSDA
jgi:hypothetical protein